MAANLEDGKQVVGQDNKGDATGGGGNGLGEGERTDNSDSKSQGTSTPASGYTLSGLGAGADILSTIGDRGEFSRTTLYRSDRPMATAAAVNEVRRRFENPPLLVVLSRHGAKEIACSAVLGADEKQLEVWGAHSNGSVANGELQPIYDHLATLAADAPRFYWVEVSTQDEDSPDLLDKLLQGNALSELQDQLTKHSARLVVVMNHDGQNMVRYRYPQASAVSSDWFFAAAWLEEWFHGLRHTPKGGELEVWGLLSNFEKQLAELTDVHEYTQWNALRTLASALPKCDHKQAVQLFAATLAQIRDRRLEDPWLTSIEKILATPPGKKRLQKELFALLVLLEAARVERKSITHQALQTFGLVCVQGVLLEEEEKLQSVQEDAVNDVVSLRVREFTPIDVRAEAVWEQRLDHLLKELGFGVRLSGGERIVEFPDAASFKAARKLLFESYSGGVMELLNRLLNRKALFHLEPDVRGYTAGCLLSLWDLDRPRFMELGHQVMEQAEALMKHGPQVADVNYGTDVNVFRRYLHSICVCEFYRRYALSSDGVKRIPLEKVEDALLPRAFDKNVQEALLRTRVCIDLPDFTGLARLARKIDCAPSTCFEPLLRLMLVGVNGSSLALKAVRLSALGGWLLASKDHSRNADRPFLLAEKAWIGLLMTDEHELGSGYDPTLKHHALGMLFLENPPTGDLWPALLRVSWARASVMWIDLPDLLQLTCKFLLMARVDTQAEESIRSYRQEVMPLAEKALANVNTQQSLPRIRTKLSNEALTEALRRLDKAMAMAREASDRDPKMLNQLVREILKEFIKEEAEIASVLSQLDAYYEYPLQPLRLLTGLMLAHWCFHRTGIQVDAEFRDGETVEQRRELVGRWLDSLVKGLRGQEPKFGAETIVWQWEQLERALKFLIADVKCAQSLDATARASIAQMLEHKQTYLNTLSASLKRRLASPPGAP